MHSCLALMVARSMTIDVRGVPKTVIPVPFEDHSPATANRVVLFYHTPSKRWIEMP